MYQSPTERFWNALRRFFGGGDRRRLTDRRAVRRVGADRRQGAGGQASVEHVPAAAPAVPIAPPPPSPADMERQRRANRAKLIAAFNAAQPVNDRYELSGRTGELAKLVEHVIERHSHAIIHGPRGSGKTSLARIFGDVADEGGCIALYQSTTGDTDFATLMQPYLEEIRLHVRRDPGPEAEGPGSNLGAREFAAAVAELNSPLLLLILDEFDRIESKATRDEVAALMKLLSDIKSPIRFVIVGIAATVDDVIAAHPSLRRHLVSLALTPITEGSVMRLIREGGQRAGLTFSEEAKALIASLALGSPYHVRLFCLNGGLAAIRLGDSVVDEESMEAGLKCAYEEWVAFNPAVEELAVATEDGPAALKDGLKRVLGLAARRHAFTDDDVTRVLLQVDGEGVDPGTLGPTVIERLMPLLSRSGRSYSFIDTLTPQFLLLRLSIPFNQMVELEASPWGE